MNKKELAQFLFDNFYDTNTNSIRIYGLDFRNFKCNVDISKMNVGGVLYQNCQKAKKIFQSGCEAKQIFQCKQVANYIGNTGLNANEIDIDKLNLFDIGEHTGFVRLTPKRKNLTKKEIEKLLGYEINIIGEN